MVSDKRAIEEANEIRALKEGKETEKNTGLKVSASLLLPKILWIKKNRKEYSHIRFFLTSNDYLIYKLYGNMVTDYLNAMKFHYKVENKDGTYPEKLLKKDLQNF